MTSKASPAPARGTRPAEQAPGISFLQYASAARRALLIGIVAFVPLLVVYGAGFRDPFNTPKVALLIFGIIVAAAIRGAEAIAGAPGSGMTRLILPAMSFSIPFFAAWLASPDHDFALWGWDYGRYQGLAPYLLAVALGVLIADGFAGRAHQIAWALAAAGTAVSAYAIVQFLGWDVFPSGPGWSGGGRAVTTLGNPNFTGGFLAICLAATLPLALGKARAATLAKVMGYAIAIGVGRSYSQGAWIAAIGGVAVALGIMIAPRLTWARMAGTAVAVFVAVGSIGAALVAIAGVDLSVLSTVRSRGLTWETALRAAEDELLLGHGLNSFGQVQTRYRSDEAAADQTRRRSVPDDPHSVPLAMLVNAGLLSFLGFVGVISWFVVQAIRVPAGNQAGAACVGAITAYLTQALVSIDEVSLRVTFWVCLGALAAFHAGRKAPDGRRPVPKPVGRVRMVVAGAFVVVAVVTSASWAVRFIELHKV
ncbi:MAG TPA: O-antigen ligase family protein [Actinomycetota bacterium]|nr:O-antigen ligase family protein [Actinomycetota bacterium]